MFSVKEDYFSEIIECHVASKLHLEIEICMLVNARQQCCGKGEYVAVFKHLESVFDAPANVELHLASSVD